MIMINLIRIISIFRIVLIIYILNMKWRTNYLIKYEIKYLYVLM